MNYRNTNQTTIHSTLATDIAALGKYVANKRNTDIALSDLFHYVQEQDEIHTSATIKHWVDLTKRYSDVLATWITFPLDEHDPIGHIVAFIRIHGFTETPKYMHRHIFRHIKQLALQYYAKEVIEGGVAA